LDGARQIGPLDRDIAEVHWNAGTHQRVGFIADVKVQVRLRGIARRTEFANHVAGFYFIAAAFSNYAEFTLSERSESNGLRSK
jgi:hypothetical protein